MRMRWLVIASLLLVSAPPLSQAQIVNVLPQADTETPGFGAIVTGSVDRRTGATDVLVLSGRLQTAYRDDDRVILGIASGEFGDKAGDRFASRHFAHLRYRSAVGRRLAAEAFVQREANEFRRLASRALAGVGLRVEPYRREKGTVAIGSAYMRERERLREGDEIDAGSVSAFHRWSNYVSIRWVTSDTTSIAVTAFVQPKTGDFADWRALTEGGVTVAISRRTSLAFSYTLSHDSKPPDGVGTTDTRGKTAITVKL
jgi:hypothetical protein